MEELITSVGCKGVVYDGNEKLVLDYNKLIAMGLLVLVKIHNLQVEIPSYQKTLFSTDKRKRKKKKK